MIISPARVRASKGSGGKSTSAEELAIEERERFLGGGEGKRFSRVSLSAVCVRLRPRTLSLYDADSERGALRFSGGAAITIAQV